MNKLDYSKHYMLCLVIVGVVEYVGFNTLIWWLITSYKF